MTRCNTNVAGCIRNVEGDNGNVSGKYANVAGRIPNVGRCIANVAHSIGYVSQFIPIGDSVEGNSLSDRLSLRKSFAYVLEMLLVVKQNTAAKVICGDSTLKLSMGACTLLNF